MDTADFSTQDLRRQNFIGADFPGADFSGADVRGVDFTRANLTNTDFSGAKLGPKPLLAAGLFVVALVIVAGAGWMTGWTLQDILANVRSSEWEEVFGGSLAAIVIVVFLLGVIARGLHWALLLAAVVFGAALALNYTVVAIGSGDVDLGRDARVIGLLALLGAAMIAGGLARVLGGSFGPAAIVIVGLTGGFAAGRAGGGVAGILVSVLLVALAKRALRLDPRDRFAIDLVGRLVAERGTRFRDADLSGADFTGTNVVHCDTTGADLTGIVWDGGVGPWATSEEEPT